MEVIFLLIFIEFYLINVIVESHKFCVHTDHILKRKYTSKHYAFLCQLQLPFFKMFQILIIEHISIKLLYIWYSSIKYSNHEIIFGIIIILSCHYQNWSSTVSSNGRLFGGAFKWDVFLLKLELIWSKFFWFHLTLLHFMSLKLDIHFCSLVVLYNLDIGVHLYILGEF